MATRKTEMKRLLIERRDQLLGEIEALKNKVAGLEEALALLDADDLSPNAPEPGRARRTSTKAAVLDLLRDTGTTGLNAATAVQMADRRGLQLHKDSVSSLLSRLKRDGVVDYDGDRYRLKEFVTKEPSPDPFRVVRDSTAA